MVDGAFVGTAEYYERYRVPYPAAVFDWIVREYELDARGRLLDAGCGTGQVCVPLARWFDDVVAIDPDDEMLRVAARVAGGHGATNVRFLPMRAEDVAEELAPLRLVTFGNSFHWVDRIAVVTRLYTMISPGGGLVALASSSLWSRGGRWQSVVIETIKAWLGEERRTGGGTFPSGHYHQEILRQTPFGEPRVVDIVTRHTWTIDSLVGYLFSTSIASRRVLGARADGFERDLRERLGRLSACDEFVEDIEVTIISAKRP